MALMVLAPPDGKEENYQCADFTCAKDTTVPLWAEANTAEIYERTDVKSDSSCTKLCI